MSSSSSTPPNPPLDCTEALARTRAFAAGELDPARSRELRTHLAGCPACMANYRDAMGTAATLGRTSLAEREERAEERAKRQLHAKIFGPTQAEIKHRRQYRLRIAIIPAFFIILMIKVTGLGEPPARVDMMRTDGVVWVDGRRTSIGEEPLLILPGRWVQTGKFSMAELDGGSALIQVADRTECLLEAARPVRLRLKRGQLDLEGEVVLYTVLGMLRITGGKGRVSVTTAGLTLEPESGEWLLLDGGGERSIPLGESSTIPPAFVVAK